MKIPEKKCAYCTKSLKGNEWGAHYRNSGICHFAKTHPFISREKVEEEFYLLYPEELKKKIDKIDAERKR